MIEKMEKYNFLVLGAGGNVSQGIITALKLSNIPCKIIGACVSEESLGLYMCDSAYISPYANDLNFIDWVAELCNKESISMIFSGVEEVVFAIELNRNKFESLTSAVFISSPIETLIIGNNKYKTAEWLKNNGLNFPQYAKSEDTDKINTLIDECGFPLIAKPNNGKGSTGIYLINSKNDVNKIPNNNYCIQQYLGNEKQEYTIACYINKSNKLQELIIFRRELKYGTTFFAEIVENKSIKDECVKICDALKIKGPLNIQMRMHNGIPVCFELNVRFSGTTPIRARFGYNDVKAMITEYIQNKPIDNQLKPANKGRAYRYFNEFYMDMAMHDLLISKKEINDTSIFNNIKEI